MTPEQRKTLAESLKFANLKYNDYKEVYSKAYFFKESFMMIVDAEYNIDTYDELVSEFGEVVGVPEVGGEKFLVSAMVLGALGVEYRGQAFAPDTGSTAIRDDKWQIKAVTRLKTV